MSDWNILLQLSENNGFIITVANIEEENEAVIKGINSGTITRISGRQSRKMFTATTIDETMILIREQIEKLIGE